ncbi:hypothetical protein [Marinobacter flavimaris]|uniref:hypothetical protein n=1 Tax=Marinobacter flavimaris TaxID=262076 RepID=UPI00386F1BE9
MGWYKDINAILEQEPETWLAYLYGQQLENMPHLTRIKPKARGLVLRICRYFLFLMRHFALGQPPMLKAKADFLVFSGTSNQMSSLEGTASILKKKGKRVVEIGHGRLLLRGEQRGRYISFAFSVLDIAKSLVLLVRNGPSLYKELQNKHPAMVQSYFDNFCSVYTYLVYFDRVLKQTKPDYVITSNDHNPPNRSLLAVAHYLGIKTVYLQHASVSNLFPALRVDYAFLDGQFSLDTYRECEQNQPPTKRKVPTPIVLLSGQKKHLRRGDSRAATAIGIALNALDDATVAIQFVKELADAGQKIRVRWHPGQPEQDIRQYQKALKGLPHVQLSNPKTEQVSEFMMNIRWLVAGNSSIHLEAALAGVTPIYYELTSPDNPDYYGYVLHGLAKRTSSAAEIVELVEAGYGAAGPDVEAVRHYSATYLTEWDGREEELVGEYLLRDLACREDIFGGFNY